MPWRSRLGGDLFVHPLSGIQVITGINTPAPRAYPTGGPYHYKDGRDFPDMLETVCDFPSANGGVRVHLHCNQNDDRSWATWDADAKKDRSESARHGLGSRRDSHQFRENQSMKIARRTFLKTSAAVSIASAARIAAAAAHQPLGLQLYSVRDLLAKDFDGTLAKVRGDGYTVVEAAGYFDRSAGEFRKAMDAAGLRCVSTHHNLAVLEAQLDQWIDYGHTLGLEFIVCSSSGGMHRDPQAKGAQALDDWRWIAGEFNRIGEKVKTAGMTFGVHNHTPEFAAIDGTLVYEELLRLTDPKLVVFEMDAGWVYASGHNPVDFLRKAPQRFPLMHVKDMVLQTGGAKPRMTVLGKGAIDYGPILKAATGLKYYFVEQEAFEMEPIEELRLNAEYLHGLRV